MSQSKWTRPFQSWATLLSDGPRAGPPVGAQAGRLWPEPFEACEVMSSFCVAKSDGQPEQHRETN
eukprot:138306-Rhodomonas_salina.1